LNSLTGAITGTNTTGGTFDVTIVANNSTGSATNALTIAIDNGVAPAPIISSALTATGSLSASFNYQIAATNYPTSFFVIGLPSGLSFDPASGRIFGIPAVTGNFAVTLRALNRNGTGGANLSLTINPEPPPKIDSVSIQNGVALAFLTMTNRVYAVEWSTNLLNASWISLTGGIIGDGGTQTVVDPTTNDLTRFYRLKVTVPQ
jgi:hypothetical protein